MADTTDKSLQVELVAADRLVWSGQATMVIARTTEGDIGVLSVLLARMHAATKATTVGIALVGIAGAIAIDGGTAKIVLAVPVGPPGVARRFGNDVDEFICLEEPDGFLSVGSHYVRFGQTSDDEVQSLLKASAARPESSRPRWILMTRRM